ncbi:MAG: universal stress protein [Alphaproteobacteria bacterium]|nr:universal stress protein [Alphaproteobacteria bacterium]
MAIHVILAPVSGTDAPSSTVDVALQVGRYVDAHVEAFHVSLDPRDSVAYMAEGMTSNMIQDIMNAVEQEGRERRDRARKQFEEACKRYNVPVTAARAPGGFSASFATAVGREDELLAMRGRLSDLIVATRSSSTNDSVRTTLEIALLETGRPILIAPPKPLGTLGKSVAVAWNGSIEATRALGLGAGLHFITAAERVVILSLPEGRRAGAPVSDIIAYLGCHGVSARSIEIPEIRGGIGRELLSRAQGEGCDLLVMGAYTRSRLRHLIFGGATSEVLARADIPVLMSH